MMKKVLLAIALTAISAITQAGGDLKAKISYLHLKGDGKLWIKTDNDQFNQYCKRGWHHFNLYLETDTKDFPYYYGLLAAAYSKGQTIRISNIIMYDGSAPCDIVKTGYGVVFHSDSAGSKGL